jgi:hypothetical protein
VLFEGFHDGRVILLVTRTRLEAGVADAIQNAVDAAQRVLHAEFLHDVLATQGADAILGPGTRVQACLELCDLLGGEFGRRPSRFTRGQCRDTSAAAAAHPLIDKAWRPSESSSNFVAFEALEGQ